MVEIELAELPMINTSASLLWCWTEGPSCNRWRLVMSNKGMDGLSRKVTYLMLMGIR